MTGIIGYMDVLGYQSFLEKNQPDKVTEEILNVLVNTPDQARQQVQNAFKDYAHLTHITRTVFSDTILLFSDCNQGDSSSGTLFERWLYFIIESTVICRRLFDFGMPVRGVITFGDYIIKSNENSHIFAGKGIVKAHKLSKDIDMAGVIIDDIAVEEMGKHYPPGSNPQMPKDLKRYGTYLETYSVPLHSGISKAHLCINFAMLSGESFKRFEGDERRCVYEAFSGHRKDISPSVYNKLTNTEMFLRFLRSRSPKFGSSGKLVSDR